MKQFDNWLVLTQYRNNSEYNDFIGKYYHFPANKAKSYLKQFEQLPIEFVYYEPIKNGEGVFWGYGQITNKPFVDNRDSDYFFVEISNFKEFGTPVPYKNEDGKIIEQKSNPETYNSNNAVRKVSRQFLEGVCLDGNLKLNFKTDAHLIKILGEQLIGSEKVGILELIKNSIDANASYCKVRFEKIPELPILDNSFYQFNEYEGPVIIIEDDGIGMNREIIENGWLRPASTIKTNLKEKLKIEKKKAENSGRLGTYNTIVEQLKKEHGGRIPLGEKGVGRFATHRLGKYLFLTTKVKSIPYEYVLKINWDNFDNNDITDLDSVAVTLTRQEPSRDYGERESGTRLVIYGGRDGFSFDENKIRDINQSIMRLNSPNPNPQKIHSSFNAYLECPQIHDLEQKEIYEDFVPNFTIDALVNDNGIVDDYLLKFAPPASVPLPQEEWHGSNYDLRVSNPYWFSSGEWKKPQCGSFYIHLDAWYRVKPWIEGPNANQMKEYLDEYGGISIYRDDVIIFPAESGSKNDWLKLSQRHIKQGFRISYYNIIGNIEIEQSDNLDLIDKTNREGMIENVAFSDLSQLVITLIQNIIETKYIAKRDEYTNLTKGIIRDPKKLTEVTQISSTIIDGIKNKYSIEEDPWQILDKLGKTVEERTTGLVNLDNSIKNLKKSIQVIENVQERLTEHAGFGLAAAVSLHELTKITTNFYNGISYLIQSGNLDTYKLEDLKAMSSSLQSELKRLGPLRTIKNESKREFGISQVINYVKEIFKMKLQEDRIKIYTNIEEDFVVYTRYSTICQIFINLMDNSIYWLKSIIKGHREIGIYLNSRYRTIIFADSGVGIDESIRPYLFEPGYSLKVPPSGLGLYICKSYMQSMNGDIHETNSRERIASLNGAQFTLEFERVPKSKELDK